MRNINHANLEPYISAARLNTYSSFFAPSSQVELFGCYLWNKEIAASFLPILQVLEVSLRNSIHNEARAILGSHWFDNITTKPNLKPAQTRQVLKLKRTVDNTRNSIKRELGISKHGTVPADKIVANMTFGFWTTLLSPAFEVNRHPRALWPALLRPVFSNAPKGARKRDIIHQNLITVKTFRNKAFHHEPIWNIGRPSNLQDAINKLLETRDLILEMTYWISKESYELVEKAGYSNAIQRICSVEHLDYLKHPGNSRRPISRARRELRGILRDSYTTTEITINGDPAGRIVGS